MNDARRLSLPRARAPTLPPAAAPRAQVGRGMTLPGPIMRAGGKVFFGSDEFWAKKEAGL